MPKASLSSGLAPSIVRHWLMDRTVIRRTMRLVRFFLTFLLSSSGLLWVKILTKTGIRTMHTM